jgi:hypothetical protein
MAAASAPPRPQAIFIFSTFDSFRIPQCEVLILIFQGHKVHCQDTGYLALRIVSEDRTSASSRIIEPGHTLRTKVKQRRKNLRSLPSIASLLGIYFWKAERSDSATSSDMDAEEADQADASGLGDERSATRGALSLDREAE